MAIRTEILDGTIRTYSDEGFMIIDSTGHLCSESITPIDYPEEFTESSELIPNELTAEQKLELLIQALQTADAETFSKTRTALLSK